MNLGAEGFAPESHAQAELLKMDPPVHAKPGWVNRDCSVVGLERLNSVLQEEPPLHAAVRQNSPLHAHLLVSVTNDIPPTFGSIFCLCLSFSSHLFPSYHSVALLCPLLPLIYHVLSLLIVCCCIV